MQYVWSCSKTRIEEVMTIINLTDVGDSEIVDYTLRWFHDSNKTKGSYYCIQIVPLNGGYISGMFKIQK